MNNKIIKNIDFYKTHKECDINLWEDGSISISYLEHDHLYDVELKRIGGQAVSSYVVLDKELIDKLKSFLSEIITTNADLQEFITNISENNVKLETIYTMEEGVLYITQIEENLNNKGNESLEIPEYHQVQFESYHLKRLLDFLQNLDKIKQ